MENNTDEIPHNYNKSNAVIQQVTNHTNSRHSQVTVDDDMQVFHAESKFPSPRRGTTASTATITACATATVS
jgi:hypothetical protein